MKTVFEESTRTELISRISLLNESSPRQWGNMNVNQMVQHCIHWEEMVLRNKRYKRVLIGIFLGRMLLRNELKDDRPMRQNNPTIPDLRISAANGDISTSKTKWISLINEYAAYSLPDFSFVHPFFGKMTRNEIGYHAYKHTDHHLRQFSC